MSDINPDLDPDDFTCPECGNPTFIGDDTCFHCGYTTTIK